MNRRQNLAQKTGFFLEKIAGNLSFFLLLFLFLGLWTVSLLMTTFFSEDYQEIPLYRWDNPVLLLIFFAAFLYILYFARRVASYLSISSRKFAGILGVYSLAAGCVWVWIAGAVPQADQGIVSLLAGELAKGQYTAFLKGAYLSNFPHQLGFTAWLHLLYSIFGGENYMIPQVFNVLWTTLSFLSLAGITRELFEDENIRRMEVCLSFFCLPMIFYNTFVYGNVISLALALAGIWCMLVYMRKKRIWLALAFAFLMALACVMKSNSLIFLLGISVVAAVEFLKQKRPIDLLWILLPYILLVLMNFLLTAYYENVSGENFSGRGVPKIAWAAMGLQEGKWAPGWYNDFPVDEFMALDYDPEAMEEVSEKSIQASLEGFVEDPAYAASFFCQKIISQWNEPTFQCFMISYSPERTYSRLLNSLYHFKLNGVLETFMDGYQTAVLGGCVFFFLFRLRRRCSLKILLPGIIMLGGFLFHLVWEAKCQYALPYFFLMLPYAAAGCESITALVVKRMERHRMKAERSRELLLQKNE